MQITFLHIFRSTWFILGRYWRTLIETWNRLAKVCNVNFDKISNVQLAFAPEIGGLGLSSATLSSLPAFSTLNNDACDFHVAMKWLNVFPCKRLVVMFDDHLLRVSIGLPLRAYISEAQICCYGRKVKKDDLHGFSAAKTSVAYSVTLILSHS